MKPAPVCRRRRRPLAGGRRDAARRRLRRRAGQQSAAAAPGRRAPAGVSGQGLFGDDPAVRGQRRADRGHDRRRPQDRLLPPGATPARRRHRRVQRLQHRAQRRALPGAIRTHELFPELRPAGELEFWCGLRPATPSNVPFIDPARLSNLYLNTGHGTLGWTMACGSGRGARRPRQRQDAGNPAARFDRRRRSDAG